VRERVQSLLRICGSGRRQMCSESDLKECLLLWGQKSEELRHLHNGCDGGNLQAFTIGGYYVLASNRGGDDEIVVVFDGSPLGLPPLYAHGHADALSLWVSYGGAEFLIDPGTFCYDAHDGWRDYFRGTAAHNTMRIDGMDQSTKGGGFLWRHAANSKVEHIYSNDAFSSVRTTHDGYTRLSDPVIHTRGLRLFKKPRSLLITDFLKCKRNHLVEIFFHFSERCRIEQTAPGCFMATNDNRRLCLRLDHRFDVTLYRGSENPIMGWVSRNFGVKEPTFTIAASTRIEGSSEFASEIQFL
jgi:Heparinase II/III-like protein